MTHYTVLLLYPDYVTDNYGTDTYMTHVQASSPVEAQKLAQAELVNQRHEDEGPGDYDAEDYAVLAVIEGIHHDIKEV